MVFASFNLSCQSNYFNPEPDVQWMIDGPLTIGMILSISVYIIVAILLGVLYNNRLDQVADERKFSVISGDLAMVIFLFFRM